MEAYDRLRMTILRATGLLGYWRARGWASIGGAREAVGAGGGASLKVRLVESTSGTARIAAFPLRGGSGIVALMTKVWSGQARVWFWTRRAQPGGF